MQATAILTNTDLVKRLYQLFNEGKTEELINQFDDNCEFIDPAPREFVPYGGTRKGKAAIREFFKLLNETIEIKRMEPREYIEQNDKVVVLGYWEAKVKKTGKIAKSDWAMYFRLKNGRIVRHQGFEDTYNTVEAFRQVGGKTSGN
ncbi:MAG TPA: nuclear transport factor 2 family protein [Chitinophagales bacterium]|nr:nuclear transport factor 2 family protein [Chitinophagales bacterium]